MLVSALQYITVDKTNEVKKAQFDDCLSTVSAVNGRCRLTSTDIVDYVLQE